ANQDQIAALVMEPIQDGFLPVDQSFINGIRQITQKLGIVLIFDEVKTGFRVSMGGAQSLYNIEPDLTTLGKTVGGGFPIGVVGGKKDILMQSAPANHQSDWKAMDTLFHSGTYNGHPLILAAGMRTVKILEQEINDVFKRADVLKKELEKLFFEKGIAMQAMGIGSMFNIILNIDPIPIACMAIPFSKKSFSNSFFKTSALLNTSLISCSSILTVVIPAANMRG